MIDDFHEKRKGKRRIEDEKLGEVFNKLEWGMKNGGLTAEMCKRILEWYKEK
jgi:hypothetical protein